MYPVVEFEKVKAGIEGSIEREIDASLLTSHVGGRGIFATPAMLILDHARYGSIATLRFVP